MKLQYIYFEDAKEYVDLDRVVTQHPVGQLLFAFLDTNWEQLEQEAEALKHIFDDIPVDSSAILSADETRIYYQVAKYYQEKCVYFSSLHPLLHQLLIEQFEEQIEKIFAKAKASSADFARQLFQCYPRPPMTPQVLTDLQVEYPIPDWPLVQLSIGFMHRVIALFQGMAAFQADVKEMVTFSLDDGRSHSQLTPPQRFYLMQISNFAPYVRCRDMCRNVCMERRLLDGQELDYEEGTPITEEMLHNIQSHDLVSYPFYCSKDIRTLLFLEFEHLCCTKGYPARICETCGRYFVPSLSVNGVHDCSGDLQKGGVPVRGAPPMPSSTGGASEEEPKALYRRLNGEYLSCYPRDKYRAWKSQAKQLLKKMEAGELTRAEFKEQIQMSE